MVGITLTVGHRYKFGTHTLQWEAQDVELPPHVHLTFVSTRTFAQAEKLFPYVAPYYPTSSGTQIVGLGVLVW